MCFCCLLISFFGVLEQSTGSWLTHWQESSCDTPYTRFWVAVDFVASDEIVSMYHKCLDLSTGLSDPVPSEYTTPDTFPGEFYFATTFADSASCVSSGLVDPTDMTDRFVLPRTGITKTPYGGSYEGHTHSHTSSIGSPQLGIHQPAIDTDDRSDYYHTHGLSNVGIDSSLTTTSPPTTDLPPHIQLVWCKDSTYLNFKQGLIFPLELNFEISVDTSDTSLRLFVESVGALIRGAGEYNVTMSGSEIHRHGVSGEGFLTDVNLEVVTGTNGGGGWDYLGVHAHQIDDTSQDTNYSSSLPSFRPTVFVLINGTEPKVESITSSLGVFVTEVPPIGFVESSTLGAGNFLRGAVSTGGGVVSNDPESHSHWTNISISTVALAGDMRSGGVQAALHRDCMATHFHDGTTLVESDDSIDTNDLMRMELVPVTYVADRFRGGVSVSLTTLIDGRCDVWCYGRWCNETDVCGQGVCIDPGICSCSNDSIFGGLRCNVSVCDGKLATETATVCSGNGDCVSPGHCVCHNSSEWGGQWCQLPVCHGTLSNESDVCGGALNGSCTAPNDCDCLDDLSYTGPECNIVVCDGKRPDEGSCGGGNGTCIFPDICYCEFPSEYRGTWCDVPVCGGYEAGHPLACNFPRGECIAANDCLCDPGTSGDDCEYYLCNFLTNADPGVCSYNGTCDGWDICTCNDGGAYYNGSDCQYPVCGGYIETDGEVCNFGQGLCVSPGLCSCTNTSEYTGALCDVPYCYGILSTDGDVCNYMNGSCLAFDTCSCANHSRYTGDMCEYPVCFGVTKGQPGECNDNGTCVDFDTCVCDNHLAYTGSNCDVVVCNGTRSDDDSVCGDRNGTCVAPDICTCTTPSQYDGTWCDIPRCDGFLAGTAGECNNSGTCVAFDSCYCQDDDVWTGQFCTLPVCQSIPHLSPGECSDNGVCVAPSVCVCHNDSAYTGGFCDEVVCFGTSSGPLLCGGHGNCVAPDDCQCTDDTEWGGIACAQLKCDDIPATSGSVCNGNGVCELSHTCTCDPIDMWGGPYCGTPQCGGVNYDGAGICSDRGTCIYDVPDAHYCNCTNPQNWGGAICDVTLCFGIPADDDTVCSGHGTCAGHACTCSDATGPDCSGAPPRATSSSVFSAKLALLFVILIFIVLGVIGIVLIVIIEVNVRKYRAMSTKVKGLLDMTELPDVPVAVPEEPSDDIEGGDKETPLKTVLFQKDKDEGDSDPADVVVEEDEEDEEDSEPKSEEMGLGPAPGDRRRRRRRRPKPDSDSGASEPGAGSRRRRRKRSLPTVPKVGEE